MIPSPSMAFIALFGRAANGCKEWKNAAGKSLHDVKRSGSQALA